MKPNKPINSDNKSRLWAAFGVKERRPGMQEFQFTLFQIDQAKNHLVAGSLPAL